MLLKWMLCSTGNYEKSLRRRRLAAIALLAAGMVTFFAAAAALFVILPFSPSAFWALFAVILFYSLVFVLASGVLERRL